MLDAQFFELRVGRTSRGFLGLQEATGSHFGRSRNHTGSSNRTAFLTWPAWFCKRIGSLCPIKSHGDMTTANRKRSDVTSVKFHLLGTHDGPYTSQNKVADSFPYHKKWYSDDVFFFGRRQRDFAIEQDPRVLPKVNLVVSGHYF